jgi:hypothetical protein
MMIDAGGEETGRMGVRVRAQQRESDQHDGGRETSI